MCERLRTKFLAFPTKPLGGWGGLPVNGLIALPLAFSKEARSPAGPDGCMMRIVSPFRRVYPMPGERVGKELNPGSPASTAACSPDCSCDALVGMTVPFASAIKVARGGAADGPPIPGVQLWTS